MWRSSLDSSINTSNFLDLQLQFTKEKDERKIMQSRLFFVLLIFKFETHTKKEIFDFALFLRFHRFFALFYSHFRFLMKFLLELWMNLTRIPTRNDFKSTKRRSLKNIFTNTKANSLSWSTADFCSLSHSVTWRNWNWWKLWNDFKVQG